MAGKRFYMSLLEGETIIGIKTVVAMIDALPFPAHIKDTDFRYVYSNEANTHFYEEFLITVIGECFDAVSPQMPWSDDFHHRIQTADCTVLREGIVVNLPEQLLLDGKQRLHIQDMVKIPLINEVTMKPVAILTIVQDRTAATDIKTLFDCYCRINEETIIKPSCKVDYIELFLAHLNIKYFFAKYPTRQQCRVLIATLQYHQRQHVADHLGISVKTLDSHLEALRNRLAAKFGLDDLYHALR